MVDSWLQVQTALIKAKEKLTSKAEKAIEWGKQHIHLVNFAHINQRPFQRRSNGNHLSAVGALESLSKYLGQTIPTSSLSYVSERITVGVDGEPSLELVNVPSSFAIDKQAQAKPTFIQLEDGRLAPTWDLVVEQDDHWWHAHVDARSGKIHSLNDWVKDASYRVFPWGINSPLEGNRTMQLDPCQQVGISKLGWHSSSKELYPHYHYW